MHNRTFILTLLFKKYHTMQLNNPLDRLTIAGIVRALEESFVTTVFCSKLCNFLHFHTLLLVRRSKSMSTVEHEMLRAPEEPAYKREYPHH